MPCGCGKKAEPVTSAQLGQEEQGQQPAPEGDREVVAAGSQGE